LRGKCPQPDSDPLSDAFLRKSHLRVKPIRPDVRITKLLGTATSEPNTVDRPSPGILKTTQLLTTGEMPVFLRFNARYFRAGRGASLGEFRSMSSPMTPVSPLNGGVALTGKRGRKTPKLFRCKRKENGHKHRCTFHAGGFYRMNPPMASKFSLQFVGRGPLIAT
jgi:hypothetical protein